MNTRRLRVTIIFPDTQIIWEMSYKRRALDYYYFSNNNLDIQ